MQRLAERNLLSIVDSLDDQIGVWVEKWYTDAARTTKTKTGVARWKTWSAGVQAATAGGLTLGFAFERDDGESPDDEQFTETILATGVTRKAAPDSVWEDAGVYLQQEWDISRAAALTASVRYDRFRFDSDVDPLYVPPGSWDPIEDDIEQTEREVSGGLSLLLRPSDKVRLAAGWFRGFRLWPPKFGATQHGSGVLVPSGVLPAVIGDTFESGIKVRDEGSFEGSAFVYYTRFRRNQVITRGTFNSQDWFDFDGDAIRDLNEDVYVKRSTGTAYVYGVELEGTVTLSREWSFRSGFTWNIGKDLETDEPIRHTQPARLLVAVRWEAAGPNGSGPWVEFAADAVRRYDRVPSDRLATDVGYRRDPQDLTSPLVRPYGLPGYTVYSARGGVDLGAGGSVVDAGDRKPHQQEISPRPQSLGRAGDKRPARVDVRAVTARGNAATLRHIQGAERLTFDLGRYDPVTARPILAVSLLLVGCVAAGGRPIGVGNGPGMDASTGWVIHQAAPPNPNAAYR